ncbi:MAG: AAA family ATPase, partial [Gemmataceae bacterium]|nr:AAA family ATPase [Gemmataceae bacterium]
MKLSTILLRWYKSFHLNYREPYDKGETKRYRPWNDLALSFAEAHEFPFIEIPIEQDITTVVGANESGKSHLLNAISKVVNGKGVSSSESFARTDLCHYAGIRTKNITAWPNIGLQFLVESKTELDNIVKAINDVSKISYDPNTCSFTLILAPDGDQAAVVFFEPNPQPIVLDTAKLDQVRKLLPPVQFIDSQAKLASEIAIGQLLASFGGKYAKVTGFNDRKSVESAATQIRNLRSPTAENAKDVAAEIEKVKNTIAEFSADDLSHNSLVRQLFVDIMKITPETLEYIQNLDGHNRGYVEGQIAKRP